MDRPQRRTYQARAIELATYFVGYRAVLLLPDDGIGWFAIANDRSVQDASAREAAAGRARRTRQPTAQVGLTTADPAAQRLIQTSATPTGMLASSTTTSAR